MSLLLTLGTVFLILVSLFLILIVLMQRASANSGMGSTLGGGFSESTFGAATTHIFTRWTVYAAVLFFLITFGLYLGHLKQNQQDTLEQVLPRFEAASGEEVPVDVPTTEATAAITENQESE